MSTVLLLRLPLPVVQMFWFVMNQQQPWCIYPSQDYWLVENISTRILLLQLSLSHTTWCCSIAGKVGSYVLVKSLSWRKLLRSTSPIHGASYQVCHSWPTIKRELYSIPGTLPSLYWIEGRRFALLFRLWWRLIEEKLLSCSIWYHWAKNMVADEQAPKPQTSSNCRFTR